MKKRNYFLLIMFIGFICFNVFIFSVRQPNYSISTAGKLLIVNKLSSSVTVFDLENAREIIDIPIDIEPHEITAIPNQNKFAITNYGSRNVIGKSVSVIDADTYKIEKTIDFKESPRPHGIISIGNSSDVAVVTDVGNDLIILDTKNGMVKMKIPTQQDLSHMVVLHPNLPLAYVTNINSGSVSVIDIDKGEVVKIISCGTGTEGIDITPDGNEIWVTNNLDNTILVIDTVTYEKLKVIPTGNEALRLKFTLDGKYCLVPNSKDGTIRVYDPSNKSQVQIIELPGKKNLVDRVLYHTPRPVGILMHPNGQYAFVANSNADRVEVIDLKSLSIVSTIGTRRVPDGLAIIN